MSIKNIVPNVPPKKEKRASDDDLAKAIIAKRGNVSAVARALRYSRKRIQERINGSPALQEALTDAREAILDTAEDKLGEAVKKGEAWAVCFTLKTQGKARGYTERQEITGPNGGAIETVTQVIIQGVPGVDDQSEHS